MNIIPAMGSTKGSGNMFTGDVYFDVIAKSESHLEFVSIQFTSHQELALLGIHTR